MLHAWHSTQVAASSAQIRVRSCLLTLFSNGSRTGKRALSACTRAATSARARSRRATASGGASDEQLGVVGHEPLALLRAGLDQVAVAVGLRQRSNRPVGYGRSPTIVQKQVAAQSVQSPATIKRAVRGPRTTPGP